MAAAEEIMVVTGRSNTTNTNPTTSNTNAAATTSNNRVCGCFFRCGVGRKVSKTLKEVEKLIGEYPAVRVVEATNRPPTAVEHIPAPSIDHQTTASKNLATVMDLLSQDRVRSVGIWGMGGVGKTTLVKNLNNKLKTDRSAQRFGTVIWVTVSKNFHRKMVQSQIAHRLGLIVGESDEDRMVGRLYRLTTFRLFIRKSISVSFFYSYKKCLIVHGVDVAWGERITYLLSTINPTYMCVDNCEGVSKLAHDMALNATSSDCFSALKSLTIRNSTLKLSRLRGECGAKFDLLPNLEELSLIGVDGLRSISELGDYLGHTFSKRQQIYVAHCGMDYLLSVDHNLILENLQTIAVGNCRQIEELFKYLGDGHCRSVAVVPNLKQIKLNQLPEFRRLVSNNKAETWPSLEIIRVVGCDKPTKLPISSQNAASNILKEIGGGESWWNNLEWDDPQTKTSLQYLFKHGRAKSSNFFRGA